MRGRIAKTIADQLTHGGMVSDAADALIAALPGMVKPLVWYPSPDDDTDFCADAFGQTYVVSRDLDSLCSWGFFRHVGREAYDDNWSLDDAKAAANAHHRAQIMAAFGILTLRKGEPT